MENTGIALDPAEPRRTPAAWAGLAALALLVLFTGGLVGTVGPLLAIACDTCQDGVRTPSHGDALITVAQVAAPPTTLGTVVGIFVPKGGVRVGGIGLGALVVFLALILVLGQ